MYLGSAGMSPAKAADLGGDCCADLEERVAELEATTARKGNRRVSLTISGQVSTMIMAWDTNATSGFAAPAHSKSDAYVVDNVMAGGTFFQLAGSARINPNLTAGFQLTMALCGGARSHQVNQFDDDAPQAACFAGGNGDTTHVVTLANWYLDHKSLGRVTVGRINTATAGITTIDLGGAGVIANASIGYTQRSFFVDPAFTLTWNQAMGTGPVNGASLSRANAVSYTSPTVGGFSVSGAWGEDDIWDVALRYAGEFGGFRVAAGIGYLNNSSGLNETGKDHIANDIEPNQLKGSASILHVSSGLFLTGAFVHQDNDVAGADDTRLWYLQGGISKNWTGLGNTVLYGEYARVDDGVQAVANGGTGAVGTDSRVNMWGIGVVQHIDAAAMEVFLAYKNFEFLSDGFVQDGSDFQTVVGGARIRF
jgi:hypothetical protein